MLELLSEPFTYDYMLRAMTVGSLVGGICAFLSAYIILKGWSLIGDALSHSVVPGVALAYMLGLPFAIGAFFAGGLAATTILFLHEKTKLKQDTIIGLIFTSFFGFGLFLLLTCHRAIFAWLFTFAGRLSGKPRPKATRVCYRA